MIKQAFKSDHDTQTQVILQTHYKFKNISLFGNRKLVKYNESAIKSLNSAFH